MIDLVIPVVAALIGALAVFGAAVSAGAWLVRALRLPVELPDACRFEPRPPPVGPPEGAPQRAEVWDRRRVACDAAAATQREALRLHEILAELADPQRPTGAADRDALLTTVRPLAAQAEAEADAAAEAMHDADEAVAIERCSQAAATVGGLHAQAEAMLAALPPPARSHRSLILLGLLAAVVALWLLLMLWLQQQGPVR